MSNVFELYISCLFSAKGDGRIISAILNEAVNDDRVSVVEYIALSCMSSKWVDEDG